MARIFTEDFGTFTAAGFASAPTAGQLDSDVWRVAGLSDNAAPAYGFTGPANGDFGRGLIGTNDPTVAGVYSPSSNHALVLQPTGTELDAGGFIEARIQNVSGAVATGLTVNFDWVARNNASRSDALAFSFSTDGTNFTPVTGATFASPAAADASPAFTGTAAAPVILSGLSIPAGGFVTLRWTHTGSTGSGSRDEVGIDNVTVDTSDAQASTSVSISDVTVVEGDAGTRTAVFTVTRSDTAGAFTVNYATADGTATAADNDYASLSGQLSFAAGGPATQTVAVTINGDTGIEANEAFTLALSGLASTAGTAVLDKATGTGTIQNDDVTVTAIGTIQGEGNISAYAGQVVTTRGVVTAISNGSSKGYYIQDVAGDGNAATSDGIFVFTGTAPTGIAVGNLVNVTGTVQEYTASGAAPGALSLTELTSITATTVLQAVVALPAAVVIGPSGVSVPNSDYAAANAFFERLEGMLVTVENPLAVGPTSSFGEIYTVAGNGAGASGLNGRGNLLISGGTPSFGNTDSANGDLNPERIQIDPGLGITNPLVNTGARLSSVTGVVGYSFGNYEVLATAAPTVVQASPLTKTGTTLTGDADHLLVGSYNAENLDPGDGAARFATIAGEIVGKLNAPDIVALQEIQDNSGATSNGVTSASVTLQAIVDAINAANGPQYAYIDNPFIGNNTNGGEPGGNIRTAFIYRTDRVSFVQGSLATVAADGSAITSGTYTDQQTNPDNPFYGSRPPLSATFTFGGKAVTVLSNHFTSKGGSGALYGSVQPPFDAGEVQRAAQAQAVNNYVDFLLAANPNARVVVAGDLNDFGFEQPLSVLRGVATVTGYDAPGTSTIAATATYTPGGTAVLSDLQDLLPADQRFDYVFEGNSETLDHMLVSAGLLSGAQFQPVHINADFYDQTSDHDPLVGLFVIDNTAPVLSAASPADNAAGVAVGQNIVLTFSEAVVAVAGQSVTITNGSGDVRTIPVTDGQVTISGATVTINPSADLNPRTAYQVLIPAGAFTDTSGNAYAGNAANPLDLTTGTPIPSGSTGTTFTITAPGTYTLAAGATRTQTAGTAVQATVTTGTTVIEVQGTLNDTASGARAIRAGVPSGQVLVGAAGTVRALDGDAVQAQSATGRLDLVNLGQILSATSITAVTATGATPPSAAYALNYNAATGASGAPATDFTSGGVITNGAVDNTAALIRSDSGDAIRLGAHQTLVNYGRIVGAGPVNDSSNNNGFSGTSTAQRYDISRGVRINAATSTNDRIDNYGVIQGAQHGVDVGNTAATNILVNNAAGGLILGVNGSGVGADTTGTGAGTVVVTNAGTIRGEYAPTFDRAGLTTVDGDGDGVDVDGGATVVNLAGGVIAGSGATGVLNGQGAGGFDSNGRANRSEGLSLGGGSVTNDGVISGADAGIVVNNDSNANGSRSGVGATTVVNNAAGSITGYRSYAIRLENKTGTAADNDSIVNYGRITGNGTVPAGTVLRQDGTADAGTVGTLDGVTYTAADAGNARFIGGDGAAIQTGEGVDTLDNYGIITGNTGRAVNLEGGNDTLTLRTGGTVSGRIDGGSGTDRLVAALDDRAGATVTSGTLSAVVNFEQLVIAGGAWTIMDGQAYAQGVTVAAGARLTVGAAGSLGGAVANAGILSFAVSGDALFADGISGAGSLVQAGSGTLTLGGANSFSGGTTIVGGTVLVANAGAAGRGAIAFSAGAQTLSIAAGALDGSRRFANLLSGFGTDGDRIRLVGITGAASAAVDGTNRLAVSGSDGTLLASLGLNGDYTGTFFQLADDGAGGTLVTADGTPCYCRGTLIRTEAGDVPVEELRIGDRLLTHGGAFRPLRWIGTRAYAGRFAARNHKVLPVLIRAGALAEGVPARDLLVSPLHAMFLDGLLVPASALVNGTSILQLKTVDRVEYFHLELETHDVILAEGAWSESFLDDDSRGLFQNAAEFWRLYRDAVPAPVLYCAPRLEHGPAVEAIRVRLAARADHGLAETARRSGFAIL